MLSTTTYTLFLSGSSAATAQLSGDIDTATHHITMAAPGSSIISIQLADNLALDQGKPIEFISQTPLPSYLAWGYVVSLNQFFLINLNFDQGQVLFVLNVKDASGGVAKVDPTVVNTYTPGGGGNIVIAYPALPCAPQGPEGGAQRPTA